MNDLPKPDWGEIELDENGDLYFIYRFDSCDDDDSQEEYFDAKEMLIAMEYEFVDPYTEHDCVSGNIKARVDDE